VNCSDVDFMIVLLYSAYLALSYVCTYIRYMCCVYQYGTYGQVYARSVNNHVYIIGSSVWMLLLCTRTSIECTIVYKVSMIYLCPAVFCRCSLIRVITVLLSPHKIVILFFVNYCFIRMIYIHHLLQF